MKNRMQKWIMRFITVNALAFASWSIAADPRPEMVALLAQNENQQAYELGERQFDDWAGDVKFDFLYGIAARKAGYHQRAIFAFERVIIAEPNNIKARTALAVAYYDLDNFKAARREFDQILLLTNDPDTHQQVNQYISLMDNKILKQRERFYGSLLVNIGYDSNANSGVGDADSQLPFPGVGLVPVDLGGVQGTETYQLRGQVAYDLPMNKTDTLFIDVSISETAYRDFSGDNDTLIGLSADELKKTSSDITIGYRGVLTEDYSYKAMAYFQPFWLGGVHYQNLYGLMLDTGAPVTDNTSILLSFNGSYADSQVDNNLDLTQLAGKLSYSWRKGSHNIATYLGYSQERVENFGTDSQQNERDIITIGLLHRFFYGKNIIAGWDVEYQQTEHKYEDLRFILEDEPFFDKREDDIINAGLFVDVFITENWLWKNKIKLNYKDSNVFLYEYDKELYTSGLEYKF